MADQLQLDILQQGVEAWNEWRERNPSIIVDLSRAHLGGLYGPDLSGAKLSGAYLFGAELSRAKLSRAKLSGANLTGARFIGGANLTKADLSGADLTGADLTGANLSEARLPEANLRRANLSGADLTGADLSNADLTGSALVNTTLERATLTGCRIYGISAWDLKLEGAAQHNLVISPAQESTIAVDDLEVAQFVYLLLKNEKIRNVIETMTSKAVLILGNFSPERMKVLQAIRERLRDNGYLPILFDFEGSENRNLIDTVTTMARLVRFVIADLTKPISVPAELGAIVPAIESLPVQPLIEVPEEPYGMFSDLAERHSVLKVHHYEDLGHLLESLDDEVIAPAEDKFQNLKESRVRAIEEKL